VEKLDVEIEAQVENQPNDTNSLINDYFPDLGKLGYK
jgi:hypothetical protein